MIRRCLKHFAGFIQTSLSLSLYLSASRGNTSDENNAIFSLYTLKHLESNNTQTNSTLALAPRLSCSYRWRYSALIHMYFPTWTLMNLCFFMMRIDSTYSLTQQHSRSWKVFRKQKKGKKGTPSDTLLRLNKSSWRIIRWKMMWCEDFGMYHLASYLNCEICSF